MKLKNKNKRGLPPKKLYKKLCKDKLMRRKSKDSKPLLKKSVKKLKRPLPKLKKNKRRLRKPYSLHNRLKNCLERNRKKLNKRLSRPMMLKLQISNWDKL